MQKKIILMILSVLAALLITEFLLFAYTRIFILTRNSITARLISGKDIITILCLGESTTAMGGKDSYPRQLENILNSYGTPKTFKVINAGIPAVTTNSIMSNLNDLINRYRPDIIIAMMGINDSLQGLSGQKLKDLKEKDNLLRHLKIYRLFSRIKENIRRKFLLKRISDSIKLDYRGTFSKQIDDLKKRISEKPANDRLYTELGWLYMNNSRENNRLAAECFKKALSINDRNVFALTGLGWCYLGGPMEKEAEKCFLKALELDPNCLESYWELGRYYRDKQDYDKAIKFLQKTVELAPYNHRFPFQLAEVYQANDQPEKAKELFSLAASLVNEEPYSITKANYRALRKICLRNNIKLVCVQYPLRRLEPLKNIFNDNTDMIFVDNEKNFRKAIAKQGYDALFTDRFAVDFGHCTAEGNNILALSIAEVLKRSGLLINEN